MTIAKETAGLRRMTIGELRVRYAQVFNENTSSGHKDWLIKKIAWRLQVNASGDISERARQRAAELANDADLRLCEPRSKSDEPKRTPHTPIVQTRDERIPPVGSIIEREYKGTKIEVEVAADGFICAGDHYTTLTAVARAITGSHCNGFHFFRLGGER